ncbi:hypothetical protein [Ochrobactrum soli]|uniref:hypothetical protein n=1 Tax=Ochrobactrum soli TaxID=2448455 RepID=UPI000D6977AA|nr:hypothetical protein [[Ochrobactrum] soli]
MSYIVIAIDFSLIFSRAIMATAAKILGLLSLAIGAIMALMGLAELSRGGSFVLAAGGSAIASGVFLYCIGQLVEYAASISESQKQIAASLSGNRTAAVSASLAPAAKAAPTKVGAIFTDR